MHSWVQIEWEFYCNDLLKGKSATPGEKYFQASREPTESLPRPH